MTASVETAPVRLRQVVLVTSDLAAVAGRLQSELALPAPFVDPGVGDFGLENRVFAVGSDFVELLTPMRDGTAGGRYLERRGGDAGYMAIFQLADLAAARRRVADLDIRVVWQADLPDISGTHLHPADVPGAIVSLDAADPPESWHWAGPAWRGGAAPDRVEGGVVFLTVAAVEPVDMARRWADVLGVEPDADESGVLRLGEAGQELRFVPMPSGRREDEGIIGVGLRLPAAQAGMGKALEIGGVRFDVLPG